MPGLEPGAGERDPGDAGEDRSRGRHGRGRPILGAFGLVGQLGLTVVVGGLLGALAGYGLDRWLGTAPGFLIGGLLFGLAGGAIGAYRLIAQYLRE